VIWDRDYMKNTDGSSEAADADCESEKPTPFNLFAGLKPEPLEVNQSTVEQSVSNATKAKPTEAPAVEPHSKSNPLWKFLLMAAVVAILVLVFLGLR
jgi:hypothetical protein